MNCVIYQEIPTPFAGFTYTFTFNFGRAFKQYHWAVYLGGTILLLGINTMFFGVYWMLIVGYQMLKRDVEYVISRSKGDTQFTFSPDEHDEISNFLHEIESSEDGVAGNAEKGTDDNAKKSGKAEAKSASISGFSSLDKFQAMPLAHSAEKTTDDAPHLTKTFSIYAKDDYWHVDEKFSKEEIDKFNICSAVKSIFFPFQDRQLRSRTIYEDCLVVNPFQASAFPAIYIVFTITGLAILLAVVIIAFVALLILILNLALLRPLFPDGYPLTRAWLIETVLVFFLGIYAVALIANRYLMPREGEWKQRIKCYQGVVILDIIYLLTWGMLKAWAILATIMGVDILAWGFGRMAIWQPTLRPPFQLFDSKYAAYVAIVRAAMIAHHAKKNPRILLSTTSITRQVATAMEVVTWDASHGPNPVLEDKAGFKPKVEMEKSAVL